MNLIITKNYEEVSKTAAAHLLRAMASKDHVNLAITGGRSPKRMYEMLIPFVKGNPAYSTCQFYNFDEIPVRGGTIGLTQRDLLEMFFKPAQIPTQQLHFLDVENYENYDKMLEKNGGLDFTMIGIGMDGHFCGNLPGTCTFEQETHIVSCNLSQKLQDRITFLQGGDAAKVPAYYVTMGPKTIMNSKELVLIASGKEKAEILKKALEGPVDITIPSSILKLHSNLTVILDEEAASCLKGE